MWKNVCTRFRYTRRIIKIIVLVTHTVFRSSVHYKNGHKIRVLSKKWCFILTWDPHNVPYKISYNIYTSRLQSFWTKCIVRFQKHYIRSPTPCNTRKIFYDYKSLLKFQETSTLFFRINNFCHKSQSFSNYKVVMSVERCWEYTTKKLFIDNKIKLKTVFFR